MSVCALCSTQFSHCNVGTVWHCTQLKPAPISNQHQLIFVPTIIANRQLADRQVALNMMTTRAQEDINDSLQGFPNPIIFMFFFSCYCIARYDIYYDFKIELDLGKIFVPKRLYYSNQGATSSVSFSWLFVSLHKQLRGRYPK